MNVTMQILLMCISLCLSNASSAMELMCAQTDEIQVARAMTLLDLGKMLMKNEDYKKAKDYLDEAASQSAHKVSAAGAWLELAVMYLRGRGVEKDYVSAREYCKEAAGQQEDSRVKARALLQLGDMYYFGLGVEKDYQKAWAYYEQIEHLEKDFCFEAPEHHHYLHVKANVCYHLGRMYYFGFAVEKDYPKAYKFLEQAIYQKENLDRRIWALAYWLLGEMFYEGLGTEKDYHKAREYFEQAAKHYNELHALYLQLVRLRDLYLLAKDIKINYQKAYGNYDQLVNKQENKIGQALALLRFGIMYHFALGVKKDYQKARDYYSRAAQQEEDLTIKERATELLKQVSLSQSSMKVLKTH